MSAAWDQRIEQVQQHALASGAMEPIATRIERVRDGGFEFAVRVVASLARKSTALTSTRRNVSPDESPAEFNGRTAAAEPVSPL
jgi:ATP adenylyltransferase/5',5'''-P-1,P-4-tetraphosphate phosphorylase II